MFEHRHLRRHQPDFDKQWSKDEPDIKVNAACNGCNSGWMERLDRKAEAIFLDQASRGYPVRLSLLADRETLARWCLLVATLCDQTQGAPVIPGSVHTAVCNGDIPDGVRIWGFRTIPPPFAIAVRVENRTWNVERSSGPAGDAYFVTFVVGHFVAQAFVPTERTPKGLSLLRTVNMTICRELWPALLTPLVWPPQLSTPWDQLNELANAFEGPTG